MNKKIIIVLVIILTLIPILSGCLEEERKVNHKPSVEIKNPKYGEVVSAIVQISGTASDPDDDKTIKKVEVSFNNIDWEEVTGTTYWSYEWTTYQLEDGDYEIYVRAWDGADYSDTKTISVNVFNPVAQPGGHKWAVFIMAANFPEDNESKLGNGGLYLAQEMVAYFIENFNYPTSNIWIHFDDGFIRSRDGLGEVIGDLSSSPHKYNINYASATKEKVIETLEYVVEQANNFDDSEVFIWLAGHGCGDVETLAGGKAFERSAIYLWGDDILEDKELGVILSSLKSKRVCVLIDACFGGGFADKTIYNFPTFFLLKSRIPRNGRVVITSASKYRAAYSSVIEGPLFSNIWFEGIKSGEADGFMSGFRERGRPTRLNLFEDGKVSVEEAFYYTRYILRTDEILKEYGKSEPQINDQYPRKGTLGSFKGLVLGE